MFMKNICISKYFVFLLAFVLFLTPCVYAADTAGEDSREINVNACADKLKAEGIKDSDARTTCGCMVDKLFEKYPSDTMPPLSAMSEMQDFMVVCAKENPVIFETIKQLQINACIKGFMSAGGQGESYALKNCSCTINGIFEKYTLEQFMFITKNNASDEQAKQYLDDMQHIVSKCKNEK